jgi:dTDP-glucose pyrophosphorylase
MIKNKTVVAIIPARSGSKGLPGKNLKSFCGRPLIAWSIEVALKSKYIDDVIVSTDSEEIAEIARQYGATTPFLRPPFLATDDAATMAVRVHEWQHPFGVVQTEGVDIIGFEEKPVARSHINAGVYAIDPAALSFLSAAERCDMPTLFERLQEKELRTVAYPMHEPWLDVGRPADLQIANNVI